MYKHLGAGFGHITPEYMKAMYRNAGKLPKGHWDKIVADYKKTGEWGEISTGHASNALTAVMKPSEGLFSLCTGPAKRGLTPLMPGSTLPLYNATNAFYEIKLEETPEQMMVYTRDMATAFIKEAEAILKGKELNLGTRKMLEGYLSMAHEEFKRAENLKTDASIYCVASAVRCYTRAQVRARQVINAINPPSSNPVDLL
ncbi:hypothetical protein E4H04_09170 [Candidatus Bathyarchaeota archaeon]|jgi:hypothetical protein|nr:MAG: hypothetical protein E4H04_09170 [Candidatus Bathyarchaeota archaeon]